MIRGDVHRIDSHIVSYDMCTLIFRSSDICLVDDFESIPLHRDSFLNTLVEVILHGTEQNSLAAGRMVPRLAKDVTYVTKSRFGQFHLGLRSGRSFMSLLKRRDHSNQMVCCRGLR